jgi:hypothetical protein
VNTLERGRPDTLRRVYDEAIARLKGKDLEERCAAAGYTYDRRGIEIQFLGQRYVLDPFGHLLECADDSEEHALTARILILHYLEKASGAPPSGKMVGFDQLVGGRFYGGPFRERVETPLARAFAGCPEELVRASQPLGGNRAGYGDGSVILHPFPRVLVGLVVWRGDDEVPSNGKVIWDAGAEDYLCAEDIAVLGEFVVNALKRGAKNATAHGKLPPMRRS